MKRLTTLILTLVSSQLLAQTPLTLSQDWMNSLKASLGFNAYYAVPTQRKVKVAVFDKGFAGYKNFLGNKLPQDLHYHGGPVALPQDEPETNHGVEMAQILMSLLTNDGQAKQFEPELHLYNVYGYSNFEAAINDAIKNHIDVIIHSEIWEYGGNRDGKGFFNALVTKATQAGIIWVNSAGNYGKTTFNSHIKTVTDNWVHLPNRNESLPIRCESDQNPTGHCQAKIVLGWSDFKDDPSVGTDKDLDMELDDDQLNIIQTSGLRQTTGDANRPGYSKYPREIITADLEPGLYYIRIKNRSLNFTPQDTLWVAVSGDAVTLYSNDANESIMNPADHPDVISVGSTDVPNTSVSVKHHKPEILAPSEIKVVEGDQSFYGSSNSAFVFGAGVVMLKGIDPSLDRDGILNLFDVNIPRPVHYVQSLLTLRQLRFEGLGDGGCFEEIGFVPSQNLREVFQYGAKAVSTSAGVKILVGYDPLNLAQETRRYAADDMIVADNSGIKLWPRHNEGSLPAGAYEIFQLPQDGRLCKASGPQSLETSRVNRTKPLLFKMP